MRNNRIDVYLYLLFVLNLLFLNFSMCDQEYFAAPPDPYIPVDEANTRFQYVLLEAGSLSQTGCTVVWEIDQDAGVKSVCFNVYLSQEDYPFYSGTRVNYNALNDKTFALDHLSPQTRYYLQVQAVDEYGNGILSKCLSFLTL